MNLKYTNKTDEYLAQVLPRCSNCNTQKLYFCTEDVCKGKQLLCKHCEEEQADSEHFLHKYINVKYLHVRREDSFCKQIQMKHCYNKLSDQFKNGRTKQDLTELVAELKEQLKIMEEILTQHNYYAEYLHQVGCRIQQNIEQKTIEFNKFNSDFFTFNTVDTYIGRVDKLVSTLKHTKFDIKQHIQIISQLETNHFLKSYSKMYSADLVHKFRSITTQILQFPKDFDPLLGLRMNDLENQDVPNQQLLSRRIKQNTKKLLICPLVVSMLEKFDITFPKTISQVSIENGYRFRVKLLMLKIQDLKLTGLFFKSCQTLPKDQLKEIYEYGLKKRIRALVITQIKDFFGVKHHSQFNINLYRLLRMQTSGMHKKGKHLKADILEMFHSADQ